ncbi:MAG: flagellar hook-associated protein FlgL [Gammaproteobacteria bacterium]|jgi:flagellar hook-associated protein 3 FlgL|nr:flagellar hook-associated protein FlgL [Gammaproteobacteria bacterium]
MRVSTSYIHMQGVKNILEQQAKLIRTQDELAQGKKILVPSDNPSAAARVLDINEALAQITQYEENGNYATQRLNLEETTIDSSINVLQRVRELAIQAGNTGTYDLQAQKAIAAEMKEKLKELLDYANTKDATGDYLFAGFQSKILPFTTDAAGNYIYNGDQGQLALQIGSSRQVASTDSGAEVYQLNRTGNGVFTTDANITNGGTGRISTGSVVTPSLYPEQDYSIIMAEVFSVNVNTGSSLGTVNVASSLATNAQDPDFSSRVNIFFDPVNPAGTFDVINPATGAVLQNDVVYTTGMTVSQNGWQVELAGLPQPGDTLSITPNPLQYEYNVINKTTGATVLAAQPYTAGSAIAFDGIQVEISGQPVDGDVFTVEASRHQDIFTTLQNLITSLETPGSTEVRGVLGGDYINNGFNAGDTVTFDLNFDGQTINFSVTPPTPTNNEVATAMMTTIAGTAGIVANPDGTYTLPGTTPGVSVTFRRVGDNIEFITTGGVQDNANSVVINNITDTTNNAVLSIVASGNSVASQTTLNAAVVGDSASYLVGAPPKAYLSQQIDNALNNMDRSMDKMIDVQTRIGGRINSIESQASDNEAKKVYLQGVRSDIQDLDMAEAISNLTFQTTALQIAQQTFVKIQGLNLFDYIR